MSTLRCEETNLVQLIVMPLCGVLEGACIGEGYSSLQARLAWTFIAFRDLNTVADL